MLGSFHALFLIAWLADGDSLMCFIVMRRQIAKMSSTFSLSGSLFLVMGGTAYWGPTSTKTEFVKKFEVVPKF